MKRYSKSRITDYYYSYEEIKFNVVRALMDLIYRTKGSILTFTSKKIAVYAGIPTQPILLTLVKDVLENLRSEGLIRRYKKTSHGVKYIVDVSSPLWTAAKNKEYIWRIESPYLKPVLIRIRNEVER